MIAYNSEYVIHLLNDCAGGNGSACKLVEFATVFFNFPLNRQRV